MEVKELAFVSRSVSGGTATWQGEYEYYVSKT